jgi:Fe-S-cluster-containing dehydrogenase component
MPVQCQQCDKPPCVSVCPVEATWKESDGIVVVDYNWCIGCRYCEAACPYHARRFNWTKPEVPAAEINPDQGYLSNRLRPQGVMEKCTFCLHRSRQGKLPACLEACPWNRFAQVSRECAFQARPFVSGMSLVDFLAMDEATFRAVFAKSPIKRIKRRGFLRNVCVALGNVGTETDLPALAEAARDAEPLIAEHALWAIAEIQKRRGAIEPAP